MGKNMELISANVFLLDVAREEGPEYQRYCNILDNRIGKLTTIIKALNHLSRIQQDISCFG